MYAGNYLPIPPSRVLYTEVFCPAGPCPVGGGSYWAWASVTYAAVTIDDSAQPSIGNARGDLWTDGWVGGTRRVAFDASDNTGIREVHALVDGRVRAQAGQGCDPTARTCPQWPGAGLDVATAVAPRQRDRAASPRKGGAPWGRARAWTRCPPMASRTASTGSRSKPSIERGTSRPPATTSGSTTPHPRRR